MATAGPMPMMLGSQPMTLKPRKVPYTGRPSSLALERFMRSTAAAPSLTWLALPAVVDPSFLNAPLSFASPSRVVPARGPSSLLMVTSCSLPSLSSTVTFTGMISASNLPAACAARALVCEATASSSCSVRVMPNLAATFSLVIPMGVRQAAAPGSEKISLRFMGGMDDGSPGLPPWVIDSTPAPIPTSIKPLLMSAAIEATAWRPDEHWRFTERTDAVSGIPARNIAAREGMLYAPGV
mmetsp:Transcript_17349/g.30577  ORF Transcript_17349/g.30577 Transcript_17349/m.30577 type:complete len:239 (+) Transcript_17349:364-1080(+)